MPSVPSRLALAAQGVRLPRGSVFPGDLRPMTALRLAERILRRDRRPTAMLAANDQTAIARVCWGRP